MVLFSAIFGKSDYSFLDSLIFAAVGMGIIFLILGIIMALMYLLKYVNKLDDIGKKDAPEPAIEENEAYMAVDMDSSEELVAAITAALTVCMDKGDNIQAPFRIKSIKEKI